MAYEDFKDWARKTASDKRLHDKAFNIAKNPKYDGYYSRLASMGYKCFDKKTSGSGIKNENMLNKELAEEFHKPILIKIEKKKKKKTLTFYRQYFGCWSCWYAITKQI